MRPPCYGALPLIQAEKSQNRPMKMSALRVIPAHGPGLSERPEWIGVIDRLLRRVGPGDIVVMDALDPIDHRRRTGRGASRVSSTYPRRFRPANRT